MIREGGPAAKGGKGKRKGRSAEPRAIKRRFKDSVFCDLFPRARYTIGLYRELHPEDVVATEEHVDIVTISNVLVESPTMTLGSPWATGSWCSWRLNRPGPRTSP